MFSILLWNLARSCMLRVGRIPQNAFEGPWGRPRSTQLERAIHPSHLGTSEELGSKGLHDDSQRGRARTGRCAIVGRTGATKRDCAYRWSLGSIVTFHKGSPWRRRFAGREGQNVLSKPLFPPPRCSLTMHSFFSPALVYNILWRVVPTPRVSFLLFKLRWAVRH